MAYGPDADEICSLYERSQNRGAVTEEGLDRLASRICRAGYESAFSVVV